MCTCQGEFSRVVIELSAQPLGGVMAELTVLRKTGREVIGAVGPLVILQVARNAIGAERRILPVGVAERTSDRSVCASQRKLRGAVVEGGSQPLRGVVAELTVLREAGRRVIRVVGSLIVLQVARITRGWQSGVLAARMALLACGRDVRAGQRKLGGAVIESRSLPLSGGVAKLTGLREAGCDVIGTCGGLVVLQMAGHAIRTDVGVVAIGMALQAGDRGMRSGEWKLRQVVIE